MKIVRMIFAVIVGVLMAGYMLCASVLWAMDMSFEEKNIQNVLGTSDILPSLVGNAAIQISSELEENAEDIVENFGGDLEGEEFKELYKLPEVTALFADVFTNSARSLLYGEEYVQVDEKLVEDYLCAVVNYSVGRNATQAELEDYLAISLGVYTQRFNESIENMTQIYSSNEEMLQTVRFLYNDVKVLATVATVAHMLILLLLIKNKLGYFINAAVFGLSGAAMLTVSASMPSISEKLSNSEIYTQMLGEIFRNKFALVGAVWFAIFAALMVAAMAISIYRIPKPEEN